MTYIHLTLCMFLGYCFGTINPAYIISRMMGFDIREKGSGNAGASNVMLMIGKKAGAVTALCDISKAAAASIIAAKMFPELISAKIIAGTACILGHIFPVQLGFRGGKGLACLGGMILSYDPKVFMLLLVAETVLGFSLDYICVVPMTGSLIFAVFYALLTGDHPGTICLALAAAIIQIKHIENLKRIRHGTEARISFLWKGDSEIERVKRNAKTQHTI